jgi:hypothetical protein
MIKKKKIISKLQNSDLKNIGVGKERTFVFFKPFFKFKKYSLALNFLAPIASHVCKKQSLKKNVSSLFIKTYLNNFFAFFKFKY